MLTENEIRPEELMAEQARLFAEDIARLMKNRDSFGSVSCPACDATQSTEAFEKQGMTFVCCDSCETVYANPRPTHEQLEDYYTNSKNYEYWCKYIFPASEVARREKIFRPRVEMVLDICQRFDIPKQTVLEVGAGFGIFCEEMAKTSAFNRIVGVEPTPFLAELCRSRGIEIIEDLIENIDKTQLLSDLKSVNVIANFEVIEHLLSPRDFLNQCYDLLTPGGILILTCPNSKGFDITVLKEKSGAVDVEHLNLFHPDSLALLMESCGFEVVEKQTPGKLDAELVRKALLSGELDSQAHPFLKQVLVDGWEEKGQAFQQFLSVNNLSSNMLLVGRKPIEVS